MRRRDRLRAALSNVVRPVADVPFVVYTGGRATNLEAPMSKRVVVCTPAGRTRYLSVLADIVLADPDVGRWDLWLNTDDAADAAYIRELGRDHPNKVRVVELPDPMTSPLAYRIHKFFPAAADPDEVYVRLDDDIVWYAPGSVGRVAAMRLSTAGADGLGGPFVVYGNVLNNAVTSSVRQDVGQIPRDWGRVHRDAFDPAGWADPEFAVRLHEAFLADPVPDRWYLPDVALTAYERMSINVISWTGADCARWCRDLTFDEELWLAHLAPRDRARPNVVRGDTLFVHFAFYTQRDRMDAAGLLGRYRTLVPERGPWQRLGAARGELLAAPLGDLKNKAWLAPVLASAGLYDDGREVYGVWRTHRAKPREPGLWQHPEEMAAFLIRAGELAPRSVLELGTFYGFFSVLCRAYLERFAPDPGTFSFTTADATRWLPPDPLPPNIGAVFAGIDYRPHTHSGHYAGETYDLVYIDADHTRAAAALDYARLGHCRAVAFHDINDACVRDRCADGGVWGLWRDLKSTRPHEEFIRSDGHEWMGTGLLT